MGSGPNSYRAIKEQYILKDKMREFIESQKYEDVVTHISKNVKIKVLRNVADLALERDLSKLEKANVTVENLHDILLNDKDKFSLFSVKKIIKFSPITFKSEQEFREGDGLEEDEEKETILGYPLNFLVIYLVEYFLLKNNPARLAIYLKEIKVSGSQKYAKDLKNIYNEVAAYPG